jgi:hypothetical protein
LVAVTGPEMVRLMEVAEAIVEAIEAPLYRFRPRR